MSTFKKYIFNPETLSYEVKEEAKFPRWLISLLLFVASVLLSVFYLWIYTSVLGFELPKTTLLKKANTEHISRIELINRQLDEYSEVLEMVRMRDDNIYRSMFGLSEIPLKVRNAGFSGANRYLDYEGLDENGYLEKTVRRLDVLLKKTYVQSKSFDEVAQLSRHADNMATCIPAIAPMYPDTRRYRFSSGFGYRRDPFTGAPDRHTGVDFAMKNGTNIYSTGDGVVSSISYNFRGYGRSVIVDHGFGYKTRYAHMKSIAVVEGQEIKRGTYLGESGNTGRSSGPHLHYEVIYRGNFVNPMNFMDLDIPLDEYSKIINTETSKSGQVELHPSHRNKK